MNHKKNSKIKIQLIFNKNNKIINKKNHRILI